MTLDEVETLYRTQMPTKVLEEQQDIFVFQCNVGCRVGDLISYTKQSVQNGALEYIATKTLHFSGRLKNSIWSHLSPADRKSVV